MAPMGGGDVEASWAGSLGCYGVSLGSKMFILLKLWMFNGDYGWRSSSFESYLAPTCLHSLKIRYGSTNPMVVNLYKACLMKGMMIAPITIKMPVKITNKGIVHYLSHH